MARKPKNAVISTEIETPVVNVELAAAEAAYGAHADQTPPADFNEDLEVGNPTDTVKLLVVQPARQSSLTVVRGNASSATKDPIDGIPESVIEELAALNLNTVNSIKTLYASGYSRPQIIAAGYNSSTVYRQAGEYIKSLADLKAEKAEVTETATTVMEAAGLDMPEVNAEEEVEADEEI